MLTDSLQGDQDILPNLRSNILCSVSAVLHYDADGLQITMIP